MSWASVLRRLCNLDLCIQWSLYALYAYKVPCAAAVSPCVHECVCARAKTTAHVLGFVRMFTYVCMCVCSCVYVCVCVCVCVCPMQWPTAPPTASCSTPQPPATPVTGSVTSPRTSSLTVTYSQSTVVRCTWPSKPQAHPLPLPYHAARCIPCPLCYWAAHADKPLHGRHIS